MKHLSRNGKPIPPNDIWIAFTRLDPTEIPNLKARI